MSVTTPHSPRAAQEIYLGVVGFTTLEQKIIQSACTVINAKHRRNAQKVYTVSLVESTSAPEVHIYLVDTKQHPVTQSRQWVKTRHPEAAIIFAGEAELLTDKPNEYTLHRKNWMRPLIVCIEQIADQMQPAPQAAAPVKTCLIVDDSELVRTQMEMLLQEVQVGMEFAEDAETALRMVRSKRYDLIFLDVMLPEMDGYKACKLIKADPTTKMTPVVMLTSKRSPFNKIHGALVGCDRYLTKPIAVAKVHQVLQQYALLAQA